MTEEMKASDEGRFIVIGDMTNGIISSAVSEDAAKAQAEKFADENHDEAYTVYQRVGTAKTEPKVIWKVGK